MSLCTPFCEIANRPLLEQKLVRRSNVSHPQPFQTGYFPGAPTAYGLEKDRPRPSRSFCDGVSGTRSLTDRETKHSMVPPPVMQFASSVGKFSMKRPAAHKEPVEDPELEELMRLVREKDVTREKL
jgi:hypothetical protein